MRAEAPVILDTVGEVLRRLQDQGNPVATGVPALDDRMRGGLRPGRVVIIGGAPHAGKTNLGLQIAGAAAAAGCAVACLMADEGREPAVVRVGQRFGHEREALEDVNHPQHEQTLAAVEAALDGQVLGFPDPDAEDLTMEGVAEALARDYPDHRKLLVVDSIQMVRMRGGVTDFPSIRERIMEAGRRLRRLAVTHNMMVVYISETNRAWYRSKKDEDRVADLAAFAEARLEFSGDTLLLLRASEEDPDLVEIRVPKNRLGHRTPFLLRLDRKRACFEAVAEDPRQATRSATHQRVLDDITASILRDIKEHPGIFRGPLYELVRGNKAAFDEALKLLRKSGIVRVETLTKGVKHYLTEVPK